MTKKQYPTTSKSTSSLWRSTKRWLGAGLIVWVPLAAVVVVANFLMGIFDQAIVLLPVEYRPEALFGFSVPGVGLLISIVVLLGTGMVATNIAGKKLVNLTEFILKRVPFVNSVYGASKQIMEQVVGEDGSAFKQVCLIEYPRQGVWTLAFRIGEAPNVPQLRNAQLETVYVPTSPNPTSGYVLFLQPAEIHPTDMDVEQALQVIISMGAIKPGEDQQQS